MSVKNALGVGITVLTFAGTVASGTLWISKRFSDQDERIKKIENVVKVLNTEQPEQYKQIIDILLAREAAESHPAMRVGVDGISAQRSGTEAAGEKKPTDVLYWNPSYAGHVNADSSGASADAPATGGPR